MAHTDRDDARWWWKNHFDWNNEAGHVRSYGYGLMSSECWCEKLPNSHKWRHPYRYETGVPSDWNKDCRREERAKGRNLMRKARSGHIDWDDLPLGGNASRHYRRPYYW